MSKKSDVVNEIGACAIARLDIKDGEVLLIQPGEDNFWTPEQGKWYADMLSAWARSKGKQWNVLSLPSGVSISVVAS